MASPDPTSPSADLALTVSAVARRLGVAPATLRTWDRRYGLGPSQHHAGAHRRYSTTDVARLDHMRRLVHSGVAPADAARIARGELATSDVPARAGGGQVVALPGGSPAARGLARAALGLDSAACRDIISEALDQRGVEWTWEHLISPVLIGVGLRWERTGAGIDTEHVLSSAVQSALNGVIVRRSLPTGTGPVLLAGMDGESHDLPMWAVAAGLAERGIASRMLGPRTPLPALCSAIRRTRPAVLFLWSQLPETGRVERLGELPDVRPEPMVLLGGPGWSPEPAPRGQRVSDLSEAIATIARVAGP